MSVTIAELKKRLASVPDALEETLRVPLGDARLEHSEIQGFDVVGIGASEMPARTLVGVLEASGICARFVPISRFSSSGPTGRVAKQRCLVVFSQGLSPNARIALAHAERYGRAVLFTAVSERDTTDRGNARRNFNGSVFHHPPKQERGGLVRLVGPPCATLLALRFAALTLRARGVPGPDWEDQLHRVPDAYRTPSPLDLPDEVAACVAVGHDVVTAANLMWKWQEALYTPAPLALDVLAFAHGPLQALYESDACFLFLESNEPGTMELLERFRRSLDATRHRVVALRTERPWPLSLFDYDSSLTAHAVGEVERRGIDPGRWPGQERDEPLYSLKTPIDRS